MPARAQGFESLTASLVEECRNWLAERFAKPSNPKGLSGFESPFLRLFGGMAEWFMALVLRTKGAQAPVGSNPTPSAL